MFVRMFVAWPRQIIVFMGIAFMVGTESFTLMISDLGAMPTWSVLAAPASRKVQSILENRAFRGQAWNVWPIE